MWCEVVCASLPRALGVLFNSPGWLIALLSCRHIAAWKKNPTINGGSGVTLLVLKLFINQATCCLTASGMWMENHVRFVIRLVSHHCTHHHHHILPSVPPHSAPLSPPLPPSCLACLTFTCPVWGPMEATGALMIRFVGWKTFIIRAATGRWFQERGYGVDGTRLKGFLMIGPKVREWQDWTHCVHKQREHAVNIRINIYGFDKV